MDAKGRLPVVLRTGMAAEASRPGTGKRSCGRWETISSRKSHLSWLEVHQPREWSDWKVLNVLKAFDVFLTDVEAVKPKIAAELRQLVHQADRAYENGPGGLEDHTGAGETESPGVAY
jgi:hypothetical protein